MKFDIAKLSRREFVDRSLLAASAALAAGPLSKSAFAVEASDVRRIGPNEKVRVAVIGVNGQGSNHVAEWTSLPDVDLVAICDVDKAAYEKACKRVKGEGRKKPEYYADVRKLFENKNIDAVSIATPNHWHAVMAVWAMQSGKDVYVEKLAATTFTKAASSPIGHASSAACARWVFRAGA